MVLPKTWVPCCAEQGTESKGGRTNDRVKQKEDRNNSSRKSGTQGDQIKEKSALKTQIQNEVSVPIDKWKCRRCEVLNARQFVTCIVCMETRPEGWENDKSKEKSGGCRTEEVKHDRRTDVGTESGGSAPWVSRRNEKGDEATNHSKPTEFVPGNTNQDGVNYESLNVKSIMSPSQICKNCWRNESILQGLCGPCLSLEWDCQYQLCSQTNYGVGTGFCKHCGIQRSPTLDVRGKLMQCYFGKIRDVRICHECLKINDWSNKTCLYCRTQKICKNS